MINFAELLQKEIDDKGYKLAVIAKKLCIHRTTLVKRLDDNKFTIVDIGVLKANRYLPE